MENLAEKPAMLATTVATRELLSAQVEVLRVARENERSVKTEVIGVLQFENGQLAVFERGESWWTVRLLKRMSLDSAEALNEEMRSDGQPWGKLISIDSFRVVRAPESSGVSSWRVHSLDGLHKLAGTLKEAYGPTTKRIDYASVVALGDSVRFPVSVGDPR